ncbi:MAG: NUDIX hydrolase [Calditrichaeota bacterium]|nr:MAG: NUDIX hydrolase [Calditrichota bacterium]
MNATKRRNTPKATVAAIITRGGNPGTEVLLTLRNVEPFKGRWCLPGGHIEERETARDAVIREVKEETGLDFQPHFLDYFDEIFPEYGFHAVVLCFHGPASGEIRTQAREVKAARWVPVAEARSLDLAFVHNQMLERLFNEKG